MLIWLQESAFAVWVAESIWAYPLVLTAHTIGLAVLVGGTMLFNLRALSTNGLVPVRSLLGLRPLMLAGLVVNVATGVTLFAAAAQDRAVQVVFYVKLLCILAALLIDRRVRAALLLESPRTSSDAGTASAVRRLALASIALWTGAIVAGRLIAYL